LLTRNNNPKFFYGYIVVIASFFIILMIHGMYGTYGVFFNPLQAEFSWSRTLISGANSLGFFMMGLFSIVTGRLTDRFGPRIIVIVCGFTVGLGYILMSQVGTVWQLYLFYGVIVGMSTSIGDASLLSTTARWFVSRRGIMTGIVKVGTGTGMFIMPLVASWLISSYGWRNSYVFLGTISLVSIMVIAQFLRRDPSQKGLKPFGAQNEDANSSDLVDEGLTLREAMRTRQFWMVCATYFVVWYCALSMTVHIAPHAVDLGFSTARAAGMISTIGGVSMLGRLVMGGTGDRLGNKRALLISFLVLVTALSWLPFARDMWALYLFVTIYGFAHGGFFALVSPLIAEIFGMRSHGVIFGMILFICQIGGAIGSTATGRIYDVMGSYQWAFIILIILSVIGLVLSTLLRPLKARKEE